MKKDEIKTYLQDIFLKELNLEIKDEDSSLLDLGLDSLDIEELSESVETVSNKKSIISYESSFTSIMKDIVNKINK